jgi:protein-S-isoprenylcysteine O-methyltransferase Ste14
VFIAPYDALQFAWAVWFISWLAAATWSMPTRTRAKSPLEPAYRLLTSFGAVFLFGFGARWVSSDRPLWQIGRIAAWTLAIIGIGGFVFSWWARLVLGRLWSANVTLKAEHVIVTRGPYRLVRHPIYSGILLAVLATAVLRGTASSCVGAALIGLGLFIKARVEEDFLKQELGEQAYADYAGRVPMLVPMVRGLTWMKI